MDKLEAKKIIDACITIDGGIVNIDNVISNLPENDEKKHLQREAG